MGFSPWTNSIRVKVKAKALEGKANKELCEELGKLFSAKARIVAGHKSRGKKILVEGAEKKRFGEIMQSLLP